MIFSTLAEREEVLNAIDDKKNFEELTTRQQDYIDGIYDSMRELENMSWDFDLEDLDEMTPTLNKLIKEIKESAIEDALSRLTIFALESVASFRDSNFIESEEGDD